MLEGKVLRGKFKGYFYTKQAVPFLSGQYLPESQKHIVHLYSGDISYAAIMPEYKPEDYLEADGLMFHNLSNISVERSSEAKIRESLTLSFGQVVLRDIVIVRSWEKDGKTYGILNSDFIGKVINKTDIIHNENIRKNNSGRFSFLNTDIGPSGCLPRIWEYLKWILLFALFIYLLDQCEGCDRKENTAERKCCVLADSLQHDLDSFKLKAERLLKEKLSCEEELSKLKSEREANNAKIDSLEEENNNLKLKEKIGSYSDEIFFYGDEDRIREYSEKELIKIVKILKKYPELKVSIEGFVNGSDPSKVPNLDQRRANKAKNLLVNRGISPDRILAKGMGGNHVVDKDKLFTAPDGTQYNRNMRAIIKIYED